MKRQQNVSIRIAFECWILQLKIYCYFFRVKKVFQDNLPRESTLNIFDLISSIAVHDTYTISIAAIEYGIRQRLS